MSNWLQLQVEMLYLPCLHRMKKCQICTYRLPKIYLQVCVWTCFLQKKNLLGSDEGATKKGKQRGGEVRSKADSTNRISSHQPCRWEWDWDCPAPTPSHHRRIERQADAVVFGAPAALRRGQPPRHSSLPVPRRRRHRRQAVRVHRFPRRQHPQRRRLRPRRQARLLLPQLSSEFTYNPRLWPRDEMHKDFLNVAHCFSAQRSTVRVPDLDPKYKISVLASKQDHCLFDLLYRWQEGRLPVDINCVISNHDRPQDNHVRRFLQRHGIPYHYLPTTSGNKSEQGILELIQGTDFVVLARYMQILSESFLKAYGKDIINIHHGLLPSFKGGHPSRQAFNAGVKLIGATSHFVTPELDAGPIIEQMVERVSHRDTLQSFVMKSENLEKQCLAEAIKSYCELRVLPYELKKTVVF